MAQATKPKAKLKTSVKAQRELQQRINRGQATIQEMCKREGLQLTIKRIQIFVKSGDRHLPGGELSPEVLARMTGLPEGTLLFPRVELAPVQVSNGQQT